MNKLILIFSALLLASSTQAQWADDFNNNDKKKDKGFSDRKNWGDDIWSEHASHYRPLGWFVNPGLTYMMGNSANDNTDAYNLTPSGLPGYYVEAGMEHLFKKANKIVHYFDWGIGVKHFGGQEAYNPNSGEKVRGNFNFGNAFGRADIHNVWQLTKWNFIDQSIGFNFDYRIYGGKEDTDYTGSTGLAYTDMPKMVGQFHYSIGWGLKVRDGFFIVPTFQTPILTLLPFNDFNPGHTWFQSRYQPMIFTVKFAWLFPKKGCPDVDGPDDDYKRSQQYQMQ